MPRPRSKRKPTLEEQAARGDQAARALESGVVAEAFDALEDWLRRQWELPPSESSAAMREEAYQLLQATKKVRQVLTGYVTRGKVALVELEQQRESARESGGPGRRD